MAEPFEHAPRNKNGVDALVKLENRAAVLDLLNGKGRQHESEMTPASDVHGRREHPGRQIGKGGKVAPQAGKPSTSKILRRHSSTSHTEV